MNKIVLGDCLKAMKKIKDKSIDMILCDMPYGTTACKWDSVLDLNELWKHYKRIIKDNGAIVLTASQPFTTILILSNMKMFKYCWVWEKQIPSNFLNTIKQPLRSYEDICVFYKRQSKYNPQLRDKPKTNIRQNIIKVKQRNKGVYGEMEKYYSRNKYRKIPVNKMYPINILKINIEHKIKRLHPTQKPIALFEYLIKTYTNKDNLVLDNCAGSGTTGIACLNLKRKFILIEKEKKYYKLMRKRIKDHIKENIGG